MEKARRASVPFSISISKVNCLGAIVFTIGCSVLVVNAILSFLPFIKPTFKPPIWVLYVEGALSIMSSALFVTGGAFGIVYVVNTKQEENDETKREQAPQSRVSNGDVEKGTNTCDHGPLTLACPTEPASEDAKEKSNELSNADYTASDTLLRKLAFNGHEIWTYYIRELGFLTTTIFLCSSIIFFSASIAAIITIVKDGKIARWIRYPQLVAAVGFLVASLLIMYQTQKTWWRPAWHNIRWYVGLGNFVGSAGFIFCSCFGLFENVYWARYQFGMSYLWGE